jgi:hypothetical protein
MPTHQWTFPRDPGEIRNMPRCLEAMQAIVDARSKHSIDATADKLERTKDVVTGKLEDGQTDRISKAFDGRVTVQGLDAGDPFEFPGTLANVCNTRGKAYDRLILACLSVTKANLRDDIEITSDASDHEWDAAAVLASDVVGGEIKRADKAEKKA